MKLTAEKIKLLSRYNDADDSLTGGEWVVVWSMLDKDGSLSAETTQELCDLALAGLAVQPRPIADAPKGENIYGYSLFEKGYCMMEWLEGDGYALWSWKDELLADTDPEPLPTYFIAASSLPKPQE